MNLAGGSKDLAFDHNAIRKPLMTQITWDGERPLVHARKWRELMAITRKGVWSLYGLKQSGRTWWIVLGMDSTR
jgi:hypothetical protein